jgi:hypothetical protein
VSTSHILIAKENRALQNIPAGHREFHDAIRKLVHKRMARGRLSLEQVEALMDKIEVAARQHLRPLALRRVPFDPKGPVQARGASLELIVAWVTDFLEIEGDEEKRYKDVHTLISVIVDLDRRRCTVLDQDTSYKISGHALERLLDRPREKFSGQVPLVEYIGQTLFPTMGLLQYFYSGLLRQQAEGLGIYHRCALPWLDGIALGELAKRESDSIAGIKVIFANGYRIGERLPREGLSRCSFMVKTFVDKDMIKEGSEQEWLLGQLQTFVARYREPLIDARLDMVGIEASSLLSGSALGREAEEAYYQIICDTRYRAALGDR